MQSGFGGVLQHVHKDGQSYDQYGNGYTDACYFSVGTIGQVLVLEPVTQSQKQYQNGQLISDFRMVETRNKFNTTGDAFKISNIRQKVMDYIYYSVIQGERVPANSAGSCASMCGKGIFAQKCCASVNAWNYDMSKKDFWYVCVDRSVAPGDMTMNVADYNVQIKCVQSGSMKLVAAASALLALVSTM